MTAPLVAAVPERRVAQAEAVVTAVPIQRAEAAAPQAKVALAQRAEQPRVAAALVVESPLRLRIRSRFPSPPQVRTNCSR